MKDRLKVIDFKYNVLTTVFMFIFVISILAPLSGNDWISFINGKDGIINSINNITYVNGNILSDTLANLFAANKGIFNIVFAILITFTLREAVPLLGMVENKYHYILMPLLLLLVGVETFSYNFISVTGAVCYTFPACMIIIYYLYLYKLGNNKFKFINYLVLLLMILYISLSTVYLSLAFLLSNIVFFAYRYLNTKEFPLSYVFLIIIEIFVTIISLFYIDKSIVYSSFGLALGKIPKFIEETFSKNILLILIGCIPIDLYLNDKLKNFSYKRVVIVLFTLVPILSMLYNFFNYSPVNLNLVINKYSGVFATEQWYFIFYYIIYMFLLVLTTIKYIGRKKSRYYILILLGTGFITNLFRIISPDYTSGSNILFVIAFIITIAVLYKEMDIKLNKTFIKVFTVLLILYYVAIFAMTKYIDVTRNSYIKEQRDLGSSNIIVKSNPFLLMYRYNPNTVFQKRDFKKYLGVSEDTGITVKYFGVFRDIKSNIDNNK